MPVSLPPQSRSTVVAALRAAGCVFAEDEAGVLCRAAGTPAELTAMVARRTAGLPLEHVVGWAEFCGLRIAVDPGVFVPRRRTEFLASKAIALARPGAVVADLCCGSGAVGAAVAAAVPGIDLYAVDLDPAAVWCARRNLPGATVYHGDLDTPLPARLHDRVDVLIANVPHVPTGEISLMPREARDHEPVLALDGGVDGLDVLRRVTTAAPRWLAPAGHLLIETGARQAPAAADAAARAGLRPRIARAPKLSATVLIAARRPGRHTTRGST